MPKKSLLGSKVLRVPGQGVDERLRDYVDDTAFFYVMGPLLLLLFAGWEWFAEFQNAPRQPIPLLIAALAFAAFSAYRFPRILREADALRLGRDGERYMAQILEGLREDGARIFHDIPADGFNLDHVIVSAKGVYVVETKARSKQGKNSKITFDGTNVFIEGRPALGNPIGQARGGASWLARLIESASGLKVPVRPVVAFPDWFVESTGTGENSHAWVLSGRAVPGRISAEPPTLTMKEVAAVSHAIAIHVTRHEA